MKEEGSPKMTTEIIDCNQVGMIISTSVVEISESSGIHLGNIGTLEI
jgi:hypothetical protein